MNATLARLIELGLPGGTSGRPMASAGQRLDANRPSRPDSVVIEILTDPDESDVQQVLLYWRGYNPSTQESDATLVNTQRCVLTELISRIVGPKGWTVPINEVTIVSGASADRRRLVLRRDGEFERPVRNRPHQREIVARHPRYCPASERHDPHEHRYAYLATDGLRMGRYECDGHPVRFHPARSCPDDSACHHGCAAGPCWRVSHAGPLSAARYPDDRWPADVVAAELARGAS